MMRRHPISAQDVLAVGNWLQMGRVDTARVAAEMVDGEPWGYRTDDILICEPGCSTLHPLETESAIALPIPISHPFPAAVADENL